MVLVLRKAIVSLCLLFFSFTAIAQQENLLAQMGWLEGQWVNQDSTMVEEWRIEKNEMFGRSFAIESPDWINNREGLIFELEQLELRLKKNKVVYMATTPQHNNVPVSFLFEGRDKYTYSFYSSENDFPKWIIYQRVNDNTLHVILKSEKKEVKFYYYKILPTGEKINE